MGVLYWSSKRDDVPNRDDYNNLFKGIKFLYTVYIDAE